MSITLPSPLDVGSEGGPSRRYWTREDYYRAGELGLFRPGERLELIKGEIVTKMSPQGIPHAIAIQLCETAADAAFEGQGCHIRAQMPMTLPDDSEPEPDIAVVRGGIRDYETRHPSAVDVLLLIEVSDSTLAFDRRGKAALYAQVGIPDYWVVNLRGRQLEVRRDPVEDVYQDVIVLSEAEFVSPLSLPNVSIPVTDLLPRVLPSDAGVGMSHV